MENNDDKNDFNEKVDENFDEKLKTFQEDLFQKLHENMEKAYWDKLKEDIEKNDFSST